MDDTRGFQVLLVFIVDCLDASNRCSIYCDLLAASAWAFKLEEVEPLEKKRANKGWMKEWKTTWAPLFYVSNRPTHDMQLIKGYGLPELRKGHPENEDELEDVVES